MLVLMGRTDLPRGAKAGAGPSWLAQGGDAPRVDGVGGSRGGAGVPLGLSIGGQSSHNFIAPFFSSRGGSV